MKERKRSYFIYLQDMLDAMYRIESYIQDLSYKEFQESKITVDAVIRNLEVIGEAANRIPDNVKEKYPDLPWKQMYALRNFVIHEYFGIDYENIWKIISTNMKQNIKDPERVIEAESKS